MKNIFIDKIKKQIKNYNQKIKIIFPEGHNLKIEKAALILKENKIIEPVLIVNKKEEIKKNGLNYISIDSYFQIDQMANTLFEIRKHKGLTKHQSLKLVQKSNYFATMLLYNNEVDGYVGGIEYSTADTLRPSLQIIKTAPGIKNVSSVFIMEKNNKIYLFADCAININPNIEQIVEISQLVSNFGFKIINFSKTRVALLSFLTYNENNLLNLNKDNETFKMLKAYQILNKKTLKNESFFGPIQFDAAFINEIMHKKTSLLDWKKEANIFIFPNLISGNISYKIAQRMGNFNAIGPILLGLAKSVNDLSRGASIDDIINVSYITALQKLLL